MTAFRNLGNLMIKKYKKKSSSRGTRGPRFIESLNDLLKEQVIYVNFGLSHLILTTIRMFALVYSVGALS